LLIVDDSALMRRQLTALFQTEADFEIRQARNGEEVVRENREFEPDVITLDINMPEMDGLTALSLIMAERPIAVVMVSSLTAQGALATFEALNLGAVDYVAKPDGTISLSMEKVAKELVAEVRNATKVRLRGNGSVAATVVRRMPEERKKTAALARLAVTPRMARNESCIEGLVVIGASTGGPRALQIVVTELPATFPWPVVVAQHMPAAFTRSFADRPGPMLSAPCERGIRRFADGSRHDLYRTRGSRHDCCQPRRQTDGPASPGKPRVSRVLADSLLDAMDFVMALCEDIEHTGIISTRHEQGTGRITEALRALMLVLADVTTIEAVAPESRVVDIAGPAALLPLAGVPKAARVVALRHIQDGETLHWVAYTPAKECFFQGDDPLHIARQVGHLSGRITLRPD